MSKTGFVVGKFTPFHLGHKYLINTALEQCDLVYVLPYSNPKLGVSDLERWENIVRHYQRNTKLVVLFPDLDNMPNNAAEPYIHRMYCAKQVFDYVVQMNGAFYNDDIRYTLPDVVFTSEDYGDGLAAFFSRVFDRPVEHVCVDKDRINFPISGTLLRSRNFNDYDKWVVRSDDDQENSFVGW